MECRLALYALQVVLESAVYVILASTGFSDHVANSTIGHLVDDAWLLLLLMTSLYVLVGGLERAQLQLRTFASEWLIIDAMVHLVTPLLVEWLQSTLVAKLSLVIVFLVLEKYVAQIVEAVRVVLVQIDSVLVGLYSLVEHVERAICDAKEKEDLSSLILQTLFDLFEVNVLVTQWTTIAILRVLVLILNLLHRHDAIKISRLELFNRWWSMLVQPRRSPMLISNLFKDFFRSRLELLTTPHLHHIHTILESLLVEAEGLSWQLEPHADHVTHIHQALVQVTLLHLRGHHFD